MQSCGACENARAYPLGSELPFKDELAGCRDMAIAIMTRRTDFEQRNVNSHRTAAYALIHPA